MNQAHFHLVVNHLPIIFPIVGLLILIGGIIFRSEIIKRAAYFIFIIGSLSALVAMNSGEGAEEIAENLPGVTDSIIHEHEEAAELFASVGYLLGAVSLLALWANWMKKGFSSILSYVVLLISLVIIILGKQAGTTGGEIRHTEIRTVNAAGNTIDTISTNESEEGDDD